MTIPQREGFLRPVLKAFSDGEPRTQKQIDPMVAKILNLSNEEAKELAMHSTQTLVEERVAWSIFSLVRGGLLIKVGNNGYYKISPTGLKAVNSTANINALL